MEIITQDITAKDFNEFSQLFYLRSGICLYNEKKYLIIHRLQPLISNDDSINTFSDLLKILKTGTNEKLISKFVDALTTNYSFFFRDDIHFRFIHFLIKHKFQKNKPIRIWSAACSSGEEPYSIALTLMENFPELSDMKFHIYASDISETMLNKAEAGIYKYENINKNMGTNFMDKYFDRLDNPELCKIKSIVKKNITFQKINLLETPPFYKSFDLIFLRNVLIYFNTEKKELILNNISLYLKKDGYLIIGLSESLVGTQTPFKHIDHSIYKLK